MYKFSVIETVDCLSPITVCQEPGLYTLFPCVRMWGHKNDWNCRNWKQLYYAVAENSNLNSKRIKMAKM